MREGLPGLAIEAMRPGTLLPPEAGLPKEAAEAPESLAEQAVRSVAALADPLTAFTFLSTAGVGALGMRAGVQAILKKFGPGAVGKSKQTILPRLAAGQLSFGMYDAATETLRQLGEVRRGEREAVRPTEVAEAAGRGVLVGTGMGLAGALPVGLLAKAA